MKNIVLDIGGVLIDYRWREMCRDRGMDERETECIGKGFFGSRRWADYERGYVSSDEIMGEMIGNMPEYEEDIRWFVGNTELLVVKRPEVWKYVRLLKESGYGIYLLSNYGREQFLVHTKGLDFMELVDGAVISYEVHERKPEPAIYQRLLRKYHLKAEDCLFLDDKPENTVAAEKLGFKTFTVTDGSEAVLLEELKELLKATEHGRQVPEELLKAFSREGGFFYPFNQFVHTRPGELNVGLRGNGAVPKIIVYRNNHVVWELSLSDGEAVVGISFNHARYAAGWREYLTALRKLGFKIPENYPDKDGLLENDSVGMLFCRKREAYTIKFVKGCYSVIDGMMKTFFAPKKEKDMDYFKDEETKYKKNLAEKRWQHSIFNQLKFTNNGLFAYDLEFSQPQGHSNGQANEPDMMAIRYENGEPVALVLIEVKSLKAVCEGKTSGVFAHLDGMKKYSVSEHIEVRRREVNRMLSQYKEMNLYVKKGQKIPPLDNKLKVEIFFIFTSADLIDCGYTVNSAESAIHYYINSKSRSSGRSIDRELGADHVLLLGEYRHSKRYSDNLYDRKTKDNVFSLPETWN